MRPRRAGLAAILTAVMATPGCGMMAPNARYIYQDGEFGVIGIPQNSPYGSRDYRKQAQSLMAQHFPEGFEIVRAEEVVEGQRVLDKSQRLDLETAPSLNALSQKIDLGKLAQSTTTQTKDSLPILESRIIYRRKAAGTPVGPNGYAASAKTIPEFYLDPNEMARCREKIELAELRKKKEGTMVAEKPGDPAVHKASTVR